MFCVLLDGLILFVDQEELLVTFLILLLHKSYIKYASLIQFLNNQKLYC